MDDKEADRRLRGGPHTGDLNAFLSFYEALLWKWGYKDDDRRAQEVERVRGVLTRPPGQPPS